MQNLNRKTHKNKNTCFNFLNCVQEINKLIALGGNRTHIPEKASPSDQNKLC